MEGKEPPAERPPWPERRLGQLLAATPKNKGVKGQLVGRDSSGVLLGSIPEDPTLTLAEQGLAEAIKPRPPRGPAFLTPRQPWPERPGGTGF